MYVKSKNNDTKEPNYKTEIVSKKQNVVTKGKGWGGIN